MSVNPSCKLYKKIPKHLLGRQMNRVVIYEETTTENRTGNIEFVGSAYGAPIRVCSRPMTGACNPGVCDCPPHICIHAKRRSWSKFWRFLKLAAFIGAVAWTVEQGVWSDARKSENFNIRYRQWADKFFSTKTTRKRTPAELYEFSWKQYNMKHVWNGFVLFIGDVLIGIPSAISAGFLYLWNMAFPKRIKDKENKKDVKNKTG